MSSITHTVEIRTVSKRVKNVIMIKMMEVYKIKGDTDMVKQKFLFKLSNGDKGSALQTHKS